MGWVGHGHGRVASSSLPVGMDGACTRHSRAYNRARACRESAYYFTTLLYYNRAHVCGERVGTTLIIYYSTTIELVRAGRVGVRGPADPRLHTMYQTRRAARIQSRLSTMPEYLNPPDLKPGADAT